MSRILYPHFQLGGALVSLDKFVNIKLLVEHAIM